MTDPISDADLAKIDELIIIRSEYRGKHPKARSVAQSEYYRGRIDDLSSEIIDAFPAILSRLTAAEQDRDDARTGWEQAAETIRELEDHLKSARDRAYAEGREAMREEAVRYAQSSIEWDTNGNSDYQKGHRDCAANIAAAIWSIP